MLISLSRALISVLLLLGVSLDWSDSASQRGPTELAAPNVAIAAPGVLDAVDYQPDVEVRICRVTAYCDRGTTAAGIPSGVGQCAGPADLPFGTEVYIPALDRTFIVTDRTAKRFRHNTVDLFVPDKTECKQFGRNFLECHIRLPVEKARYGDPDLQAAVTLTLGDRSADSPRVD